MTRVQGDGAVIKGERKGVSSFVVIEQLGILTVLVVTHVIE